MNKIYESIKQLKKENCSTADLVINLSEKINISLEESYNNIKEYEKRQIIIDSMRGSSKQFKDFGSVNEYGIPMIQSDEEWL